MFVKTVSEDEATGAVADFYEEFRADMGHVPNFARAFSLRPEALVAWEELLMTVKTNMEFRRYEIATIGAARALASSYCMLAHGSALMKNGMSSGDLEDLARSGGGVSDAERAVFDFAGKVARDATSVSADDIEGLRKHGLSDTEIFDVAATAAARCFISKMADAMGAQPDAHYHGLDAGLKEALVVGRPIDDG